MPNTESRQFAVKLVAQLAETVERLSAMSEMDLAHDVDHGCAMDGGLHRLLVHNAEHERQHAAPISNARQRARQMPEAALPRLIRDLIHQRAEVISLLLDMDDDLLDAKPPDDDWSVREHVEHLLFWENDSMAAAVRDVGSEVRAP